MRRAVFLLVLLLAGCTFFGGGGRTPEENIHTGTEGLVMSLDAPPQKVFAGDPFAIIGMIGNKGAADVDNGLLTIGLEDDFVTMEGPRVQQLRLAGRSAIQPMGDVRTIRLDLRSKQLPAATETVTTSILLTMCYPYQTIASVPVCIDTDLENKATNKPCKAGASSPGNGQGAPVAVSAVSESMMTHEDRNRAAPIFTITIDNVGRGQVVAPDRINEACAGRPVENINKAQLRAYLVDTELSCAKEGTAMVSLDKGKNTVRCTLPAGIEKTLGTYSSVLRVELTYGYSQSMSQTVQLVRGR